MENTNAITIEHLYKNFKLYHEYRDSLKKMFISGFRRSKVDIFPVLHDINLEIHHGEFFGIIGRNGSGKSTLLKIIAGIYMPDKGKLTVNGKITPFLELGVGFNPDLTARENIFLNGVILGLTRKEIEKHFDEIVDFAEVREFIDMQLKKFSSGMQIRLAFAIAIHSKSEIFIIDEILAVGDMVFAQKCFDIFEQYKKEGKTIILVSHDLASIRRFCDRAAYIKKGKIIAVGQTSEVIDKYIYEDRESDEKAEEIRTEGANNNPNEKEDTEKALRITSVKFLDKSGSENNTFISGDAIELAITYENLKHVPSAVIGIAIFDQKDNVLFGTNSLLETKNEVALQDKGTISVTLRDIPLNKGSYLLTVAAHDRNGVNYDWLDKKYQFNMMPSTQTDGIIRMETAWK